MSIWAWKRLNLVGRDDRFFFFFCLFFWFRFLWHLLIQLLSNCMDRQNDIIRSNVRIHQRKIVMIIIIVFCWRTNRIVNWIANSDAFILNLHILFIILVLKALCASHYDRSRLSVAHYTHTHIRLSFIQVWFALHFSSKLIYLLIPFVWPNVSCCCGCDCADAHAYARMNGNFPKSIIISKFGIFVMRLFGFFFSQKLNAQCAFQMPVVCCRLLARVSNNRRSLAASIHVIVSICAWCDGQQLYNSTTHPIFTHKMHLMNLFRDSDHNN